MRPWPTAVLVCNRPRPCLDYRDFSAKPSGSELSYLIEVFPVVLAQPFITYSSVKPFNISVLLWLSCLGVLEGNASLFCPELDCTADVFRALKAVWVGIKDPK
jgi:hypothetical protein